MNALPDMPEWCCPEHYLPIKSFWTWTHSFGKPRTSAFANWRTAGYEPAVVFSISAGSQSGYRVVLRTLNPIYHSKWAGQHRETREEAERDKELMETLFLESAMVEQ